MRFSVAVCIALTCLATPDLRLTLTAQSPANITVWSGVYSDTQAARGQAAYAIHCASCHQDDLSGYQSILKGDRFMNEYREASLDRLYGKLKTTMPRGAAGSLSDETYVDILSYVLKSNEFPAGRQKLGAEDLSRVLVVRQGGPEPVPNFSLVQVVGCLVHDETENTWIVTDTTEPVRATQPQATPDELRAAEAKTLGTSTFELMLSAAYAPDAHWRHKVDARGFLIRRPAGNRINITGLETVAVDCRR
jgi:mono/diheme cytochrome c family protein